MFSLGPGGKNQIIIGATRTIGRPDVDWRDNGLPWARQSFPLGASKVKDWGCQEKIYSALCLR